MVQGSFAYDVLSFSCDVIFNTNTNTNTSLQPPTPPPHFFSLLSSGAFELIQDESKAGACLWITKRRGMEYWPTPEERRMYMVNPNKSKGMLTNNIYPSIRMPEFFEKM